MKLKINKIEEITVVTPSGSLDVAVQGDFKDKLLGIIDSGSDDIVLDLSEVVFVDSSCLGTLVALTKKIREKDGDLKMTRLNDDVRSIFQITRLDKIFEIFENNDEAIQSFFKS